MESQALLETLEKLVRTAEDGIDDFALAAEKVTEPTLQSELHNRAQLCKKAVQDLHAMLLSLGGEPERGRSLREITSNEGIPMKARLGEDNLAALDELERDEDHACEVYQSALKQDLPAAVRMMVEEQYQGVVGNHERVRDLRDGFRSPGQAA